MMFDDDEVAELVELAYMSGALASGFDASKPGSGAVLMQRAKVHRETAFTEDGLRILREAVALRRHRRTPQDRLS